MDWQVRVRIIDGHYPDAVSAPYIQWSSLVRAGKLIDPAHELGRAAAGMFSSRWGDAVSRRGPRIRG